MCQCLYFLTFQFIVKFIMVHTTCSVSACNSSSRLNKELRFHQFPHDEERCRLWVEACKRPDLVEKTSERLRNAHICNLHFEKHMYGKKSLKKTAVPTLLLPTKESGVKIQVERLTHTTTATTSSSANEMETLVIKTEEDDEDDEEMPLYTSDRHGTFSCMTQTSPIPEAGAPFDFKQPGPSDSSEILRLKHLLEEKSTVIYKQAKKIEMLDHEVNRLLARNQYLEDLLKESGISYED
ncbi:uncharacterized protein isoform X5 [Choristoneura fumiferana]|uniref:uncharacterized protein isoform X5 n=1 Tax=Choristoneura fumiferana TaxID=7141 RepID=UPI003D15C101